MKVYLDNNATTPTDPRVLEAMVHSMQAHFGNPASTTHAWGWEAEALVEIAREQIGRAVRAPKEEIIFTSCATEALGLVIQGLAAGSKARVIASSIEHKAVLDNLALIKKHGHSTELVGVDSDGRVDLSDLESKLKQPTRLTCIIGSNNEIGVIQDLSSISSLCRKYGSLLLVDHVQTFGKLPIDLGVAAGDFSVLSAHKIYGPKGIAALHIRRSLIPEIEPMIVGGGHEKNLRSGTLNVPGIVGFGKAASLIESELPEISVTLTTLSSRLLELLKQRIPELRLNGPADERLPGNLNLRFPRPVASQVIAKLSSRIALSAGSACTSASGAGSHVLQAIGISGEELKSSIRIGIGRFNTAAEIDYAAGELADAYTACLSA